MLYFMQQFALIDYQLYLMTIKSCKMCNFRTDSLQFGGELL